MLGAMLFLGTGSWLGKTTELPLAQSYFHRIRFQCEEKQEDLHTTTVCVSLAKV